jgi:hypothetical protein
VPGTVERDSAAVDALFAALLRAGEDRAEARRLLAGPLDESVLMPLLRRAVPVAFLDAVAATRPWSEHGRVLARVVLSPRAPRALSLRLVGALGWRDLAEVAATLRVSAAVRARAESLLCDGLGQLRLGDRVTLARIATPALLPLLLADADRRVVEAALVNARLREPDVVGALRREDAPVVLLQATAASSRWSACYAVRLAIVLQPRAPLALALGQVSSLVPRDLQRVAGEAALRPLLRLAAERVLGVPPV